MKNIVITGYQSAGAAGIGLESLEKALENYKDHSREITQMDDMGASGYNRAFHLLDLDFQESLGKGGLRNINRNAKLAFLSIDPLFPGYKDNGVTGTRPGVVIGTALGSAESIALFFEDYLKEGFSALRPLDFPNTVINAPGSFINIRYELPECSVTVTNGFQSSLDAFIYAADYIKNGYYPKMLAGGSEEIGRYSFNGQALSGIFSGKSIKPFSSESDGTIAGEGSAFFMFDDEELIDSSTGVLAKILSYDSGYCPSFQDRTDLYNRVIKNSGLVPGQIDLIVSCANGVKKTDDILKKIYQSVFKHEVSVSVPKILWGECYGASQALGLAVGMISMKNQKAYLTCDLQRGMINTSPEKKPVQYILLDGISCENQSGVMIFENRMTR